MSDTVTLSLRAPIDAALEVDGVTADRFAGLAEREIAALPVRLGARTAELGDFFSVRGERSDRVRVEGALAQVHGLAAGTTGGEMVIDGDAGRLVAAKMTGGSIEVRGSVADEAGAAMGGGTLLVTGNAGDRLGACVPGAEKGMTGGMTGGEIVIGGSAGADAAARARRGLVVVAGNAGRHAARAMIAGTLLVLGRTGAEPGRASKRGTIIAVGGIEVPITYWHACTFRPPHVRLTLTYLRRRYRLAIDEGVAGGAYRRYCGAAGDHGRGEILEWAAQ
jgi:formylmethanofuran dehydrogenase subunit C